MAKPSILIAINTNVATDTAEFGRAFIEALCQEDARLVPEKLGVAEDYKDPFLGVDDFLANWWAMPEEVRVDGVYSSTEIMGPEWLRRSKLTGRGMVMHGFVNLKNVKMRSRLWFESHWARDVDFAHLFYVWVKLSQADAAMLHLFTDAEKEKVKTPNGSAFKTGSLGGPMKPGIANIGWAMAYGEGYAHEVDVEAIRQAGFPVQRIGDVIVVQVTEKLSDVLDDFAYFSRRRAELKSFFRPDLFWIKDEPALD